MKVGHTKNITPLLPLCTLNTPLPLPDTHWLHQTCATGTCYHGYSWQQLCQGPGNPPPTIFTIVRLKEGNQQNCLPFLPFCSLPFLSPPATVPAPSDPPSQSLRCFPVVSISGAVFLSVSLGSLVSFTRAPSVLNVQQNAHTGPRVVFFFSFFFFFNAAV